ncbi:MAG: carbon-nitrogen hydrolase family protein [Clostridiales bacterium]|nr:carbon-nitrogen hydrolase family protein [Clostridiales bacterium]
MGRFLNVGIVQMPITTDIRANIAYLADAVERVMLNPRKPDLVVGCESVAMDLGEPIPGPQSDIWAGIAKRHGIYFIPGSMGEWDVGLAKEGPYYNTAPVYSPDGELVCKYRKMAPYRPLEDGVPGSEYCVFEIPERKAVIGLQICYDLNFPEVSRNLALMGAEVLVKITLDPSELYMINKHLHYARAVENQAYLVSVNATGPFMSNLSYGNSMVVDPEGRLLWETGENPCNAVITLDLDAVTRVRQYGSEHMDHYMQHLRDYNFPMPFAGRIGEAPVYKDIGRTSQSVDLYIEAREKINE